MKKLKSLRPVTWFQRTFASPIRHIRRVLKKNNSDNISAMAGQSAFFVMMSVVPLIMFVLSLLSLLLGNSEEITLKVPDGASALRTVITEFFISLVNNSRKSGAIPAIVTIILALWSAGKGMYIITDGISRIYRLRQKHTWLLRRVFAMIYTIVLLFMFILSGALIIFNTYVENFIGEAFRFFPYSTQILYGLRYVILTVIQVLFLTLALKLYLMRKVKDKRFTKFRVLLPGTIFTAVSWGILSWGVNFYTTHFTSSIYGSMGTVIILMIQLYFMMYLLLGGIQINYIYRHAFYHFRLRDVFKAIKKKLSRKKAKPTEE
ncbi:MAG: YihY/virulence factor BrkB family protein [Ruminococcus sp.]|nr:YihY/virulence factor BrkB family protein [Ruminococcus sp.]